jgi:hypothetical protein
MANENLPSYCVIVQRIHNNLYYTGIGDLNAHTSGMPTNFIFGVQ